MRKIYTKEELQRRISKKYHNMIDWDSTFFYGFDGYIVLIDNGQTTKLLSPVLYERVSNINWYLRKIQENPNIEW